MGDIHVLVHSVQRSLNSRMGNPSYIFNTDHGSFRTETDSGHAYALENDFTVGETLDIPAILTLTPQGRVMDWKVGG